MIDRYNLINSKGEKCKCGKCGNDLFVCTFQIGILVKWGCCQCGAVYPLKDGDRSARLYKEPEQITEQVPQQRQESFSIVALISLVIGVAILLGAIWLTWSFRDWISDHTWSIWLINIIALKLVCNMGNNEPENAFAHNFTGLLGFMGVIIILILMFQSVLNFIIFIVVASIFAYSDD